MPNLHVLFLQVAVVVGLMAVAEASPCRHHAREACSDGVSFHQHQGRADSNRPGFDGSYLDVAAAAAALAAPPSSGFNTDRMERWVDRDLADEEMEKELERWYGQWHEMYENDDNTYNDNDYDGNDEDNDVGIPYPTTTYHHRHHHYRLVGKRSATGAPVTREDFETLYPLTSSHFHIGSEPPPPPSSKRLTYPPPRPPSSVPGAVIAPALAPFAGALTSSQASALTSLHREHVAQFAVLNDRFRKEVSGTRGKHAKKIADILGVPFIEVGKSGRPRHVDLDSLSVVQTRELVTYSQFVEFELRALFSKQMGERVGLLRTQRNEWNALQQRFGVNVVGEGEQKSVYWGGLDQGDVSYYGDWLEKRGEALGEDNDGDEGLERWMGKSKNIHGAKYLRY